MNPLPAYFFAITGAVTQAAAWWSGVTLQSAILGWISVFFFALTLSFSRGRFLPAYLSGCLIYALGFSWLYSTIQSFGGFPVIVSSVLFLLFVFISGIQLLFCAVLYKFSPPWFLRTHLALPFSWITSQILWIRIFPWEPGHTQLAWLEIAQSASLGGTNLITFVMLWFASFLGASLTKERIRFTGAFPVITVISLYCYGSFEIFRLGRNELFSSHPPAMVKVGIVQANVQLFQAHDMLMFQVNQQRYTDLTQKISEPGMLVVWPEAVQTEFVPDEIRNLHPNIPIPSAGTDADLLFGGLTFDRQRRAYNASLAVLSNGQILPPYHKQILMPFGEYMPFASIFPALEKLLPGGGSFTPGNEVSLFKIGSKITASPLICYEDITPELSRTATLAGANLLVNQTNDVWFGESLAPEHHHRMASFRAIENRRTLVRSTNTGLSGIIDPMGRTIGKIQPFSDGTLVRDVPLLSETSFYSRWVGELPWKIIAWIYFVSIFGRRFFRKKA